MADARTDRLVWIDCEMTGLDPVHDEIVEIAVIVTDAELNELDGGVSVVVRPADLSILERMDDVVVRMHTESGLLVDIPNGIPLAEAGRIVMEYVTGHVPEMRRAPLAGSSVYVDRGFLARYLPELDAHLHYRLVDVSTIKELARRWYPRAYFNAPVKTGGHRALADTRESIAELRYYRDTLFVAGPGPSANEARSAAANHVVDHSTARCTAGHGVDASTAEEPS
ncbi:MAG: oligoribonuclease [Candidatus Nanopelagicales bacterium]